MTDAGDIEYVELYFGVLKVFMHPDAIASVKVLMNEWWRDATLEEVFALLAEPHVD